MLTPPIPTICILLYFFNLSILGINSHSCKIKSIHDYILILLFFQGKCEKNIKNINIKIPCIEEQQNIADFILIFTKKLENQKAQLEHWKQIKKGLLQQMFV